jgi:hypothetical protein
MCRDVLVGQSSEQQVSRRTILVPCIFSCDVRPSPVGTVVQGVRLGANSLSIKMTPALALCTRHRLFVPALGSSASLSFSATGAPRQTSRLWQAYKCMIDRSRFQKHGSAADSPWTCQMPVTLA